MKNEVKNKVFLDKFKKVEKRHLSVRVDKKMVEQLEMFALKHGSNLSSVVNAALAAFCHSEGIERPSE